MIYNPTIPIDRFVSPNEKRVIVTKLVQPNTGASGLIKSLLNITYEPLIIEVIKKTIPKIIDMYNNLSLNDINVFLASLTLFLKL